MLTQPELIVRVRALLAKQAWISDAPALAIFLANNRRQRQLLEWRGQAFDNDNLDVFFNASVDAAIGPPHGIAVGEVGGDRLEAPRRRRT